jgi:hypothetical protein
MQEQCRWHRKFHAARKDVGWALDLESAGVESDLSMLVDQSHDPDLDVRVPLRDIVIF